MLFFKQYLEQKLQQTGKSRAELYKALGLHRSTIGNYLKDKRTPTHAIIKDTVSFFSSRKVEQRKDLHFIYFGE